MKTPRLITFPSDRLALPVANPLRYANLQDRFRIDRECRLSEKLCARVLNNEVDTWDVTLFRCGECFPLLVFSEKSRVAPPGLLFRDQDIISYMLMYDPEERLVLRTPHFDREIQESIRKGWYEPFALQQFVIRA